MFSGGKKLVTYCFILKPEEVAEIEISITECDGGITLLQIAAGCPDQGPYLQFKVKR